MTGRGCSAEAATAAMTAATGVMTGETVVAVGLGCSGNGELDNQAGRAYRNWFGIRSISRG